MWRYEQFQESLLRDVVIELENEKANLKRRLNASDRDVRRLKVELDAYKNQDPALCAYDVTMPPETIETLHAVAEVSLVVPENRGELHVVGKYMDKGTRAISFRYYISKDALYGNPEDRAGILAYLHSKVMETLKEENS